LKPEKNVFVTKSKTEMKKRKRKMEEPALPPEQREGDTTVAVSLASHVRNKAVEQMVAIGKWRGTGLFALETMRCIPSHTIDLRRGCHLPI